MAVNLHIPDQSSIYPVAGIDIGIAEAGIRKANRKDLTVFTLSAGTARRRAAPLQTEVLR